MRHVTLVLVWTALCFPLPARAQESEPSPPAPPPSEETAAAVAPVEPLAAEVAVEASAAEPEAEVAAEPVPAVEAPAEEALPWAGSTFSFDQAMSATTLSKSAQLSYNPTYAWSFTLAPRWNFSEELGLTLRQDVDFEWSESDDRNSAHEVWVYDPRFDFSHSKLFEYEDTTLSGSVRVRLPLSKSSRAANRILDTGLGLRLKRPVDEILEGVSLSGGVTYDHHWATENVASVQTQYPCEIADGPEQTGTRMCSQNGGPSTLSDDFGASLGAAFEVNEALSVSMSFGWTWKHANGLADAVVPVETAPGGVVTLPDGSDTHWRNGTSFGVDVGYTVLDWLSASFSLGTGTSQLNPDGTRRNPFYNYDTQLSLSAEIALDKLYGVVGGDGARASTITAAVRSAEAGL